MTIRADLSALDHAYRAKRSGVSKVEYAASVQGYRRPVNWRSWALKGAALALILGAIVLGATR